MSPLRGWAACPGCLKPLCLLQIGDIQMRPTEQVT